MLHSLKCDTQYWQAIAAGKKNYECRLNDREYSVNDILKLNETVRGAGCECIGYTGRVMYRKVTHVLDEFEGLKEGYVILTITTVSPFEELALKLIDVAIELKRKKDASTKTT